MITNKRFIEFTVAITDLIATLPGLRQQHIVINTTCVVCSGFN